MTRGAEASEEVINYALEIKSLKDDLIAEGVIIEFISTKSKLTIIRDIVKIFLKHKPAIVHAHFMNFIQLITAFLSWLFAAKYFISFHSTISLLTFNEYRREKGLPKQLLLRFYYRFLLLRSKNVFCISDAIKNQFSSFSGSKSLKIKRLNLGVSLHSNNQSKTQIRSFLALPEDKILLCNVSAIEYIKGLDILIKAIGILKYKIKLTNFIFCHIGGLRSDTNESILYREELYSQVKELKLENEFLWLGQRNDIDKILSAFDIYVHPSRMEGLPVSIMEACTHSLPVVGTRVGGIPEIIHHELNGFLFSLESSEELAGFLNQLIVKKDLRVKMGKESFKIVEQSYNVSNQTKQLVNFYTC